MVAKPFKAQAQSCFPWTEINKGFSHIYIPSLRVNGDPRSCGCPAVNRGVGKSGGVGGGGKQRQASESGKKRMWHFLGMSKLTDMGSAETKREKERLCTCLQSSSTFSPCSVLPEPGDRFPQRHSRHGQRYFGSTELWISHRGSRDGQLCTAGWESTEK